MDLLTGWKFTFNIMAKAFVIPTMEEVYHFIAFKRPEWPRAFVEWYGAKFWNHYQATGWRLSSNVAMKDWKAAFSSRWNDLSYELDRKKLQDVLTSERQIPKIPVYTPQSAQEPAEDANRKVLEYLNTLLEDYKAGKFNNDAYNFSYKTMMGMGVMKFTREEIDQLVADAGNSKERGRILSVKYLFGKMTKENKRFS